jgi:membrane-associated phospholipid phosphatase
MGPVHPGWRRIGPGAALPPPPPAAVEYRELDVVRRLNAATLANPAAIAWTEFLHKDGGKKLWFEFARQYRASHGLVRGWLGTGLLWAGLKLNSMRSEGTKYHYRRLRPYDIDPSIQPTEERTRNPGYPSGHTATSFAASTILGALWPARAHEFEWWANQVGISRMSAGAHFPSDVAMGALLGRRTGLDVVGWLLR